MLHAVEYLRKVGVGITGPEFFRADDGNIYVVKRSNNYIGPNVLISEWLASLLGEKLSLPFPKGSLINLTNFITHQRPFSPLGFASLYIPDTKYATAETLCTAINLQAVAGMILFDHLFFNADRTTNRKNILLAKQNNTYCIYGIDHSHLFNTGRWTKETLNKISGQIKLYKSALYGTLLLNHLTVSDFAPYIKNIIAITDHEINSIFTTIPNDWPDDDNTIPALKTFVAKRFSMVNNISEVIFQFMNAK